LHILKARLVAMPMLIIALLLAACSGEAEQAAPTETALPTAEPTAVIEPSPQADTPAPADQAAQATPTPEVIAQAQAAAATATLVNAQGQPLTSSGEVVVARVNGIDITQAAFQRELTRAQQQFEAADMAALEAVVLDTLIEQAMIEQAAAERQITVTDAEVEAEFILSRSYVDSDAAWQQWLADNLYTEDEYRASLRSVLLAGKLRDNITEGMPENVPQVHARHILVATEEEANAVLARLQNGEGFAAIAASVSQDVTTREQGGDLGWFADGELYEPALSQAAFSLESGQIAGPVLTRLGYHVIQTLERGERPVPEERRPLLAQIAFERWLQGTLYNAIIERYPA
jgi:parvulin-like peptidyl-prolyl isomerase